MLQKDANEIHAPNLRYTPGPPNHTGQFQLLAAGPGWLRGEMDQRPGQKLEARSREKLEGRPQDQNEVISLIGGAMLNFQAMGRLDAKDIHLWLHESPPEKPPALSARGTTPTSADHDHGYMVPGVAPGRRPAAPGGEGSVPSSRGGFQPDRLLAEGNVVGDSPQFSMKDVQRLEVWFSSPPPVVPAAPAVGVAAAGLPGPYVPSTMAGPALSQDERGASAPAVAASPSASPLLPLGPQAQAAGGRQAHMEIRGRLLQARVLLRDQQNGDLTEVTVVNNVNLRETQTALPGDLPLLVTGQWLQATQASSPQAKITVKGQPAHMEGRGMSLTGPNIHIDRGANLLTMEGPGRMEKFLDRNLENRPLSQPGTVKIDWQKGMVFDGRKAHFQDSVNVIGQWKGSQRLQTGWLDVWFQQPISFSDTRPQQALVEKLKCGDGVFVENRTVEDGRQASYDRMSARTSI